MNYERDQMTTEMMMEGGPLDGLALEFEGSLDDPLAVDHGGVIHEYALSSDGYTYRWMGEMFP